MKIEPVYFSDNTNYGSSEGAIVIDKPTFEIPMSHGKNVVYFKYIICQFSEDVSSVEIEIKAEKDIEKIIFSKNDYANKLTLFPSSNPNQVIKILGSSQTQIRVTLSPQSAQETVLKGLSLLLYYTYG